MKETQKREDVTIGAAAGKVADDDLMSAHCALLSYIGNKVVEAAASGRSWDIRSDPLVRSCTAGMTELAARGR